MSKVHSGSCLCETVKYELCGDFQSFFLCHCSRCQKDTGSAHAANLFASQSTLNWLQGQNAVSTYQLPDSLHTKSFCQHCGSALPTLIESMNAVMVPAGSLDSPIPIPPTAKIYTSAAADWSKDLTGLPSFEKLPK